MQNDTSRRKKQPHIDREHVESQLNTSWDGSGKQKGYWASWLQKRNPEKR